MVSVGSKYSRKERKSYSVRKACWILPLLWGQMIIWSRLELCQFTPAQELPTCAVTLGLGSSSVYCEIRQFLMLFYPLNPPFGAARICRSLEKASVLCARCKVCSSLGKIATCERVLHAGKSILI